MPIKAALTANSTLIETILTLLLVGALGYACIVVVSPFIAPFLWAIILSLSTWPYYLKIVAWLGGRRGLAATALTLLMLVVFVVPLMLAFNAIADHLPSAESLSGKIARWNTSQPPEWTAKIPLVGKRIHKDWQAGKLTALLDPQKIQPVLAKGAAWLLQQGASLALAAIHIILATVMAGLLYMHGERAAAVAERFALRIGGAHALNALHIAAQTMRGVSLGIIGTALIQAILSGLGFAAAGVPGAALLGLLSFLAAVMQIGTSVIWIPTAIWLGNQGSEGWAIFTVLWGMFINIIDNFIKPYFIGLNCALPFLLILIGVVGGLLAFGFLGIFLGTTLLAVAYTVFFDWLDNREPPIEETSGIDSTKSLIEE